MKRILIVNNNLHIGGVQRALINLLGQISNDYEVTLLLFYSDHDSIKNVPKGVKIVAPCKALKYWGMSKNDAVSVKSRLCRGFWAAITRLFGRGFAFRMAALFQHKLCGYDAAVSYLHSGNRRVFYGGCSEFVIHCTQARKKIAFLHCDYGKINAASAYNAGIYKQFDAIAACSEGWRDAFLRVFPQFANNTSVVYNCHDYDRIYRLSHSYPVILPNAGLHILTVARFGKEKGIPRAIMAFASLGEKNRDVVYHIIGDGAQFPESASLISELGLTEKVILHREMKNPYGYMRACDLLLIPSFSEAAPLVIGEAACLGTPVLSTMTSSADEMITRTGFGWVCENSPDGIKAGLERLIDNPEMIREKNKELQTGRFDNEYAIRQFSDLINEVT